jgi:hypothetical protein
MFVPRAAVAFSLLALSCDGDDETEPRTEPDISAEYDVTFSGESGCDESVSLHWLEGPLQLAGLPDNLAWDFGETVLPGSVDPNGAVEFHGIKASNETSLEQQTVAATGVAEQDGDLWTIEGDITVDSLDSTGLACTKTAQYSAVEEPPGE